eukprot:660772-Prorocentrum_minimum.AAC.1
MAPVESAGESNPRGSIRGQEGVHFSAGQGAVRGQEGVRFSARQGVDSRSGGGAFLCWTGQFEVRRGFIDQV